MVCPIASETAVDIDRAKLSLLMCSKPIREAKMPRRARKNKIPAKIFNNPLFQSCVIGMRSTKSRELAINVESVKRRDTLVISNSQFHETARYEIT